MISERDVLIIMPKPIKGGAEKQFTYLITAIKNRHINYVILYAEKTSSVIFNAACLAWEITKVKINNKPRVAIVYDVYGKYAIPLLKVFGIRTIYSERNNGKHKLKLGKKCIAMADILVANSKTAITNMRKYVSRPVEFIPNAIRVPTEYKLHKDLEYRILVPARIHPTKYQLLIADVAPKYPLLGFYLYGKVDDEQYYELLKKKIVSERIENVHYMGFDDDLENKICEYNLVLIVSDNEGNSNSVLEAFANKVLCITSCIDSNKEIVKDKRFLFENTVDSIVSTIGFVLEIEPLEKEAILEANCKFVKENFAEEKMCSKYLELITNSK